MTLQPLHIKNSSKGFLDLVTKLKADKDAKVKALLSKKTTIKK
ncbi:hypothetical protein [Pedobacter hiemivivus]|nr:hypothetical protein [Pedobacter hiemivivus]